MPLIEAQTLWRQPHRAHRPGAADLDGADDRAVAEDAAGTARAVEAIEGEQLAGHEAARRLAGHGLAQCRPGGEQGRNDNCEPRNHTDPLPIPSHNATNRLLTMRIRRDHARTWSTNSEHP
jgi:hypothetical protein